MKSEDTPTEARLRRERDAAREAQAEALGFVWVPELNGYTRR